MSLTGARYQSGFGNEFASEAVEGALPRGQNSPPRAPLGLYTEQLSGTSFTVLCGGPFDDVTTPPNQMRWDPMPLPDEPADFVDGLMTMGDNGDAAAQSGLAIHMYAANQSMSSRFFHTADGELLIVPQQGGLRMATELGVMDIAPGEICVNPQGIKFRVELLDGPVRGDICENYSGAFRLPELTVRGFCRREGSVRICLGECRGTITSA